MSGDQERSTPYGAWSSPISAEMVASGGIDFGHTDLDGNTIYWREARPAEDGRGVVVRHDGEDTRDVTPDDVNVRTLVHQYGGGDFAVHDDVVFFVRFSDQRVYRQPRNGEPTPITPEPETDRGLRYADFEISSDENHLYCVREDHDAPNVEEAVDEPVTSLVRLTPDVDEEPVVVASGHGFYAAPTLSPDGDRLAWLTWDHPRMPWDGTELHVADVDDDGTLSNERVVMGGSEESVFQPAWRPDGTLHAISDRTGWWNLYRRDGDDWVPYREEEAEYGVPQWAFGLATYAFLDEGQVAVVVIRDGEQTLELITPDGDRTVTDLPFAAFGERGQPRLRSDGSSLYFVASGPATPPRLVRWSPGAESTVLRLGNEVELDEEYVSVPEHTSVPTRDGSETHTFVYHPANPDVDAPSDECPPVLVFVHGGPTSAVLPAFHLSTQFFTSRGFTVVHVNYRGSTGHGRAYREALYGEWGMTDVKDCIDAAQHLAETGRVDGDRMAIRGGSAGGFVVLSALAFHDVFAAGTSYYGVADLTRLAELTHKFESRYLDQMVGPYPEMADTYDARSPVHHADGIEAPVLLLQGEDDQVVPLSQAEEMVEALSANDVPHRLRVFEDEQHGFRRAESRKRAHEAELAFYGEVFGFDPDDDLPPFDLSESYDLEHRGH
ncbi:alpha/beta hydrolase family protein [Halobacteriaceae archaeon SHR40]|uniref:S9 family peptidase n=1 Tax=Halovenus amylolytica TaxID=2500550 RepID=UPI000FE44226